MLAVLIIVLALCHMPLRRTRYAVKINGALRILFSIIEKPDGELIVPIKAADRYGSSSGPRILEQRYSIHPSSRSEQFTTIKQTISTEDGKTETAAVLTDAVKLKSGFAIIFVRRVQDLSSERYALPHSRKKNERVCVLADVDPKLHTLFLGLFIGHPDVPFNISDGHVVVSHFPFDKFKIIILATTRPIPSHPTAEYSHAITRPPESFPDVQSQEVLRYNMQGKPPDICVRQFRNSVNMLEKMLWEKALLEVTEPSDVEFVKQRISELENAFTLRAVELGTDQQSIHMLSDGKPPSIQSSAQSPEFSRRIGRWED